MHDLSYNSQTHADTKLNSGCLGVGRQGWGRYCLMHIVLAWDDDKALEVDGSDGCTKLLV